MTAKTRGRKMLKGVTADDSRDKTVKISVNLIKVHPIYKKRYVITRQYLAQTNKDALVIGNVIVGTIKVAAPHSAVKKKEVVRAVIVRQKQDFQRPDGTSI